MNQGFQAMEQVSKNRAAIAAGAVLGGNPQQEPEIRRVVNHLHNRLDILGEQITVLSQRISPICNLHPAKPSPTPTENVANTEVGTAINGDALRLRVLSEQLSELIESIEV